MLPQLDSPVWVQAFEDIGIVQRCTAFGRGPCPSFVLSREDVAFLSFVGENINVPGIPDCNWRHDDRPANIIVGCLTNGEWFYMFNRAGDTSILRLAESRNSLMEYAFPVWFFEQFPDAMT